MINQARKRIILWYFVLSKLLQSLDHQRPEVPTEHPYGPYMSAKERSLSNNIERKGSCNMPVPVS